VRDFLGRWGAHNADSRLRTFLESASQGILAVDGSGAILLVNEKIEEMFGYRREELLGQPLEILLPEQSRSVHAAHRGEYFRNPRRRPMGVGFELAARRNDASEFPVEISLSYVREGREITALAFVTDITARKRNEERLREAAKVESLGVLAGGIAHDFNNLLVSIMGNASLALDVTPPGSPVHDMMRGVIEASERAASLVRQLLAYSGKGRFLVGQVDLSLLIAGKASQLRTLVPPAVELRLDLAEGLPPIETDAAQMQQLVANLVANAGEAIGEGPGVVTVRTACGPDPGTVLLEVEDDGHGMDAATQERIFDPFFSTRFTGRGLGLAAVHGIVRAHGGSVQVESAPGRGSKFKVRLPAPERAVA
jgi:PAS domain S-box-containing protein